MNKFLNFLFNIKYRYIDIVYCNFCEKETKQEFYESGHERDSFNDYQRCTECGNIIR